MDLISPVSGVNESTGFSPAQGVAAQKMIELQRAEDESTVQLLEATSSGYAEVADELAAAAVGLGIRIDLYV